MLSKFDDYPIHQTSEPLRSRSAPIATTTTATGSTATTATASSTSASAPRSTRTSASWTAACSIVRAGEQHAFHASRRAPLEPSELEVGPFRIDILEPMKSLRVAVAHNDTGISCDLLWIPRTANFKEGPPDERRRRHGRHAHGGDALQSVRPLAGRDPLRRPHLAIDPRRVYGTKDRSWGMRPVGSPAPGAPPTRCRRSSSCGRRCTGRTAARTRASSRTSTARCGTGTAWSCRPTRAPIEIPGVEDPEHRAARGRRGADRLHPGHAPRAARDDHADRARRRAPRDRARAAALLPHEGDRLLAPHLGPRHVEGRARLRRRELEGRRRRRDGAREPAHPAGGARDLRRPRGVGVLEQIALGPYRKYGFEEFLDLAR